MLRTKRSTNGKGISRRFNRLERVKGGAATSMVALEARLMMHAGHDLTGEALPPDVAVFPTIDAGSSTTVTGAVAAGSPLSAVPALNSRPGAFAKIYLDFNGDTTSNWGTYTPGTTPAFDQDGDATTFSDGEVASMREIFDRVAEKYSPLNINVTTVDPGNLNNGETAKVVFGGTGGWLGAQAGGVAYVGGFSNSASNTVFVFTKNLGNGYAQYAGEAAAHESGHGFGLLHQAAWSNGTMTAEYAPANAAGDAPIMGNSYSARRGMWWNGTTSAASAQDDLAVLASSSNGFGYRADDFGNTLPGAGALTLSGTTASGQGVIERTSDVDVFSFTSGAGSVSFSADRVTGGMLDATLKLQDSAGNVLASANSGNLGESLTATLASQGTYYVTVGSHGGYGDVGQYTVTGTLTPTAAPLVAPSGASATAASATLVDVRWSDNANNETGFTVQRSADGGATWVDVANVGANVTALRDAGVAGGTAYAYRVRAFDATRTSAWSNLASVTTPAAITIPAAPTNLAARALSGSAVRLTWTDNASNENGFRVYGSKDGGATWALLGAVGANVTAVDHTGLRRNQTWTYRVTAYNAAGESTYAGTASARTALSTAEALHGDTNLDGKVDFADLLAVSKNYGIAGSTWEQGDFDGDGAVGFSDLLALSKNYNNTLTEQAPVGEYGTLTAVDAAGQAVAGIATTVKGTPTAAVKAQLEAKMRAAAAKRPAASVFSTRRVVAGS